MLGQALRAIRTFHGESLTEFANSTNLAKSYVSEIENNKKEPSLEVLRIYSKRFDLPLSSILFLSEKHNESPTKIFLSKKIVALIKKLAQLRHAE